MQERKTGVFGTVKEDDNVESCDKLKPVSENNPDTIYNLLFEQFDKGN